MTETTTTYLAANGQAFTDDDVARWAADADQGFPNSEVTVTEARAWEREQEPMVQLSARVPEALRDSVRRVAAGNTSGFVRAALANELRRRESA